MKWSNYKTEDVTGCQKKHLVAPQGILKLKTAKLAIEKKLFFFNYQLKFFDNWPRHRGLGGKYSLIMSIYLDEEGRRFESRRCLYKIVFLLWN